jgi:hypothetical protein
MKQVFLQHPLPFASKVFRREVMVLRQPFTHRIRFQQEERRHPTFQQLTGHVPEEVDVGGVVYFENKYHGELPNATASF